MVSKLPLYTVISAEMFNAIRVSNGHDKGLRRVVISNIDHIVGLKDGDRYYAQQFGSLAQADAKYKELMATIQNGEDL